MWRFTAGVMSSYGIWTYRRIPNYNARGSQVKIVTDQGRVDTRMWFRNGVDYTEVVRTGKDGRIVIYNGPVAGPDAKFTHNRPVRDGHMSAVRESLGIEDRKIGCGNCKHAPDGWGSGCALYDRQEECGGRWRWPRYGQRDQYPLWEPRHVAK